MPGGSCLLSGCMAEENLGMRMEQQYVLVSNMVQQKKGNVTPG